jgi:hypothetical protein
MKHRKKILMIITSGKEMFNNHRRQREDTCIKTTVTQNVLNSKKYSAHGIRKACKKVTLVGLMYYASNFLQ